MLICNSTAVQERYYWFTRNSIEIEFLTWRSLSGFNLFQKETFILNLESCFEFVIMITCSVGSLIVLTIFPLIGSTRITLPPLKRATHKNPSVSIHIPSGNPGRPFASISNAICLFAEILYLLYYLLFIILYVYRKYTKLY